MVLVEEDLCHLHLLVFNLLILKWWQIVCAHSNQVALLHRILEVFSQDHQISTTIRQSMANRGSSLKCSSLFHKVLISSNSSTTRLHSMEEAIRGRDSTTTTTIPVTSATIRRKACHSLVNSKISCTNNSSQCKATSSLLCMEVVKVSNQRMRCHCQKGLHQPCQCRVHSKLLPTTRIKLLANQVNSQLYKDNSLLLRLLKDKILLLHLPANRAVLHSSQTNPTATLNSNRQMMETSESWKFLNKSCREVWIFSTNAADTSAFRAINLLYTQVAYHNWFQQRWKEWRKEDFHLCLVHSLVVRRHPFHCSCHTLAARMRLVCLSLWRKCSCEYVFVIWSFKEIRYA